MKLTSTFLKSMPKTSLLVFLGGVFLIFSTIGLATDVTEMGRAPALRCVLNVLSSGLFPTMYALSGFALRKQFWKAMIPIFVVHFLLLGFLANRFPSSPQRSEMKAADIAGLQSRLNQDALAIIVAVPLGYVCFLYVSIVEGRRYMRVRAEMELATEIHRVIVPPIETKLGKFEFYGRSVPSGEVGGDLIDVAGSEDNWVAYVADVSGHGVAPGVVMGMVKSAARMLLSSGEDSTRLLPRLNEVLFPLKKPDMFVTFCFIAKNGDNLRAGLAGHPAILQFSTIKQQITPLECPNMPLGILPEGTFETSGIPTESGNLYALYTDGLLEAANAAGEEFGLKRFQEELQRHATKPLEAIYRSLQESVARHGAQFDDQSVLLVRRV